MPLREKWFLTRLARVVRIRGWITQSGKACYIQLPFHGAVLVFKCLVPINVNASRLLLLLNYGRTATRDICLLIFDVSLSKVPDKPIHLTMSENPSHANIAKHKCSFAANVDSP